MPQVVGSRSTNQVITETRLIRDVANEMVTIESGKSPLVTFLSKIEGAKLKVNSPRHEWFEDDFVARYVVNSGTTINGNASSTTITLATDDGKKVVVGTILAIPQAVGNSGSPEIVRVTSVSGDTATVVRNLGSSGLITLAADAAIAILGSAHEEGGSPVSALSTAPVAKITYTQIFKGYVNLTETAIQSAVYGSRDERDRLQKKKLEEHAIAINRQFLLGRATESLTGGPTLSNPIRTTMGLESVISTNRTDAAGALTRDAIESFARSAFRYGSETKLLLASPLVVSAFHMWANQHQQVSPGEKMFGVNIQKIQTGHGIWLLTRDWSLEDYIAAQGFAGVAFSVDTKYLKYLYLGNRDTKLFEDVIKDGRDAAVDEIKSEVGFKVMNEKAHAKLYNVTGYTY